MLQIPSAKATNDTKKPRLSAARSGAAEKLITPGAAKRSFPERIFRIAGEAFVACVDDAGLLEPDPREHAANEPVALPHLVEHVERAPVDEPEVADVHRHLNLRDPVEAAIERSRGGALEARLTLANVPDRVDDVVALAPAPRELEDDLRRILQVGV